MGGDEGPLSEGSKSKREREGYCMLRVRRWGRYLRETTAGGAALGPACCFVIPGGRARTSVVHRGPSPRCCR